MTNYKKFKKKVLYRFETNGTFITQLWKSYMEHKDDYVTIVGYGSLLNKESTLDTMPNAEDLGFDYLEGYSRAFNMGYNNSAWLNIKSSNQSIVVRKWRLSEADFENYIIREGNYEIIKTPIGLTCIADSWGSDMKPNLNYLRTCILDLDNDQKKNFFKTTFNADEEFTIDYLNKLINL